MNLIGISFHIENPCIQSYIESFKSINKLMNLIAAKNIYTIRIIDIGGGFSKRNKFAENDFELIASRLSDLIDELIYKYKNKIEIMGEPGRLICEEAQSVAVRIYNAR